MVAGKVFSYPENFRLYKVLIAAKYGGHDLQLDESFEFGSTDKTAEFLSKFPLGRVPAVHLEDGQLLSESNSAAFYLAPDRLKCSGDPQHQAQVLKWMFVAECEVTPAVCNWVFPIIGILEPSLAQERGAADSLRLMKVFNAELRTKTWLVGERLSLADICLATVLHLVVKCAGQGQLRTDLPHLWRWYDTVVHQPEVAAVLSQFPGVPVPVVQPPAAPAPAQASEKNERLRRQGGRCGGGPSN